jgi:hypothetical protein
LSKINLDVAAEILDQVHLRRFRWRLVAADEAAVSSTENFATKREAIQAGEIALRRAIERGCIRPLTGKRLRDPNVLGQA